MNDVHVLNTILAYASLVGFAIVVLVLSYSVQILAGMIVLFLVWSSRKNKRLRRMQDWYLWFPLQRFIHRLYLPKRKLWARSLMGKWKKTVIADIIDDALLSARVKNTISARDYRELSIKIGEALSITDLIPRGRLHREAVRKTVTENCKAMRESTQGLAASRIPGTPEPAQVTNVYSLDFLRSRKSAA